MDTGEKILIGRIFGEILSLRRLLDLPTGLSDATIFGLKEGIENVVDEFINGVKPINNQQYEAAVEVLDEIFRDDAKMGAFKGYYDIEPQLNAAGIDRGTAIRIFTYLKANHSFVELIDKMNSSGSPVECKTFELGDFGI